MSDRSDDLTDNPAVTVDVIRRQLDEAGVPTHQHGRVLRLDYRVGLLIDRAIPVYDTRPQPAWLGEAECFAVHDGWFCTRREGHDGDHVAHARGTHVCRTWLREET